MSTKKKPAAPKAEADAVGRCVIYCAALGMEIIGWAFGDSGFVIIGAFVAIANSIGIYRGKSL